MGLLWLAIHRRPSEVTRGDSLSDETSVDGLVVLQERTVNLVNQLNMPLVEVSLVVAKHLGRLMETLEQHLQHTGQTVSERISSPWPLDMESVASSSSFSLDKLMDIVDHQRMDILETLIRVTLIEIDVTVVDAVLALRAWEHLVRSQLARATGPGQLFSPVEIPDDW